MKKGLTILGIILVISIIGCIETIKQEHTKNPKLELNKTHYYILEQNLSRVHLRVEINQSMTQELKEFFRSRGMIYVKPAGGNAFIFSTPVTKIDALAEIDFVQNVRDVDIEEKLYHISQINNPEYAKAGPDKYKFYVAFYEDVNFDQAHTIVEKYGEAINTNFDFNQLIISSQKDDIFKLAEEDIVESVSYIPPPPAPGEDNSVLRSCQSNIDCAVKKSGCNECGYTYACVNVNSSEGSCDYKKYAAPCATNILDCNSTGFIAACVNPFPKSCKCLKNKCETQN